MQYCGNISSTKSKRNSVKNNSMNSFYLSAQYVKKKEKHLLLAQACINCYGPKGRFTPFTGHQSIVGLKQTGQGIIHSHIYTYCRFAN